MRSSTVVAIAMACLPLAACEEKPTGIAAVSRPWEQSLAINRFVINNTAQIVMTSPTGTGSRLTSAVPVGSLPDPLRNFALDVYVPTDVGYSLLLDGISVTVLREDGTRTANVFTETGSRLIGADTIGAQLYSIFRLRGDLTTAPMAPSAFASIAFGFRLAYEDPTGDEVHSLPVQIEVAKQK